MPRVTWRPCGRRRAATDFGSAPWRGRGPTREPSIGSGTSAWCGPVHLWLDPRFVEFDPETAETTGEVPSNDGLAPLLWRLRFDLSSATPSNQELLIALVDADPNGRPRYDAVAVRLADEDDWDYVGEMEWVSIDFEARAEEDLRSHLYGSWSKVLHIDRFTGALRFYRGEINRLHAYPDVFEDRLTEAIGPWPGEPDRAVADWWLDLAQGVDLDTFIEQGERLNRYFDRMTEWVLAEEEADLILAYHSTLDVYLHGSLITDELQWAYSPGRALAASEGLKRMGRSIDRSVASLWRLLDPERDALVVVSDHGQIPIFEIVRPNRALADAGLVKLVEEEGRPRVAPDTPMIAVTSGAMIHLYLNLAGREPGGVVTMAEAPELSSPGGPRTGRSRGRGPTRRSRRSSLAARRRPSASITPRAATSWSSWPRALRPMAASKDRRWSPAATTVSTDSWRRTTKCVGSSSPAVPASRRSASARSRQRRWRR